MEKEVNTEDKMKESNKTNINFEPGKHPQFRGESIRKTFFFLFCFAFVFVSCFLGAILTKLFKHLFCCCCCCYCFSCYNALLFDTTFSNIGLLFVKVSNSQQSIPIHTISNVKEIHFEFDFYVKLSSQDYHLVSHTTHVMYVNFIN